MVTNKLTSVAVEQSKIIYDKIIDFLDNVYRLWSQGKNLVVVEITEQPQTDFNIVTEEEPTNVNNIPPSTAKLNDEDILSDGSNNGTVNKIKMCCKVQMQGHSKGATITAIGLKKKKRIKIQSLYLLEKKISLRKETC